MALKKTQLERLKAASLQDQLKKSAPPELARQKQRPLNDLVAELLERGLDKEG